MPIFGRRSPGLQEHAEEIRARNQLPPEVNLPEVGIIIQALRDYAGAASSPKSLQSEQIITSLSGSLKEGFLTYTQFEIESRLNKRDREAFLQLLLARPITTNPKTAVEGIESFVAWSRQRLGDESVDAAVSSVVEMLLKDTITVYKDTVSQMNKPR